MSIIEKKNKKTIVLFQNGLGDEGGFYQTISLLKSKASSLVVNPNITIDMKNYDTYKECFFGISESGYLTNLTSLDTDFYNKIANIVNIANNNVNKPILIMTSLSLSIHSIIDNEIKYSCFDSIENQSKKLIHIIETIKHIDDEINIILIGHSQGGLVNLEAVISIPSLISNVISISTPYSPVTMANKLINLNFFSNMINIDAYYEIINNNKNENSIVNKYNAIRYQSCVETLGSNDYFDNLKTKWNNLTIRPKLTIIAGVSGKLYEYIVLNPPSISYYPFDGLVTIDEQTNIEHADIYGLTDSKLECYNDKLYMNKCCSWEQGNYYTCKRKCCLETFNVKNTLFKIGLDALNNSVASWVSGNGFTYNFESNAIIKEIKNGINRKEISNNENKAYYDIYASDYSHMYIRRCDETIGLILSVILK